VADRAARAVWAACTKRFSTVVHEGRAGNGSPFFVKVFVMSDRGDIVVHDRFGKLIAVAEVKAVKSQRSLSAIRDDLRLHTGAPYVVVVARDKTYIWSPHAEKPAVESTARLLNPYLHQIGTDAQHIGLPALRATVHIWLSDLTGAVPNAARPQHGDFAIAIADGVVAFERAA
jgi:hypothetical protein